MPASLIKKMTKSIKTNNLFLQAWPSIIPFLVLIVTATGLFMFEKIMPDVVYTLFAYPAAHIAALFMGSSVIAAENGEVLIPLANQFIHVTPSCSGFGFFCIFYAFVVYYLIGKRRLSRWQADAFSLQLLALPIVYVITIITNACRIVSAYHVNKVSQYFLPENFQASLHQGVGIALFLSVFLFSSLILERMFCHDRKKVISS